MTGDIHDVDETVVLRDLRHTDAEAIGEFFGPERVNDGFVSSGMHINAAEFDLGPLVDVAAANPGEVKLWLATTGDGRPLCLQMFHRIGFPGVWTYSVVTAAAVAERNGIGTKMITMGLDRLFADPAVARLTGYISVIAPAPLRIAERLGFVVEGRARRHIEMPDGDRVDALVVGLLAEEWAARRAGAPA